MKTKNQFLFYYVQKFFQDYLNIQRGLSQHTILAYRDVLKLFLTFAANDLRVRVTKLAIDDLRVETVLAFLKDLEKSRKNNALTRNHRLTALKTFFSFLAIEDVMHSNEYQRVVAIPLRKAPRRMMEYLSLPEVKAILKEINKGTQLGQRDYALLNFMYNTGARAQEVCDLKIKALNLESPGSVLIKGKGGKTRQVPLWQNTTALLISYLKNCESLNQPEAPLFVTRLGKPMSRFGLRHIVNSRVSAAIKDCPSLVNKKIGPHTFRHTIAMHMLQSGTDLSLIKAWLGHVNITTTHAYIEIDLEMKRKALDSCKPLSRVNELKALINKNADVISWMEKL